MVKEMLLTVGAFLFLLAFGAYGVITLCYPNLAERLARFNVPAEKLGRWPHNQDHHAWSSRLMGLAYISFAAAAMIWMLTKMFAVR